MIGSTLLILVFVFVGPALADQPKYPVILVPGDGGCQFEARLNKTDSPHWYCSKQSDWFTLWLSTLELEVVDCLVDNMKLLYNNVSRVTFNTPGVEIRQPGFGNTSTVEWLDPVHPVFAGKLSYFYYLVEFLEKHLNYTRNVNIRGAPYDFRKAPNEMHAYIDQLVALIEETSSMNGGQKVVLVGHSMGCLYMLYMLNGQSQAWKDKFIRAMVTLGGPWGGSVKPLRLMASGDSLGQSTHIIKPLEVRPLQRSIPSTAFLMPYDTFWADDEILVYAPSANYTVKKYKEFFHDIEFPDGFLMRQDTENLVKRLDPPAVEVHCLYGVNVKTPGAFSYLDLPASCPWYDYQPHVIYEDGDGTVNLRSLVGCERWAKTQKQGVFMKNFTGAEHLEMLQRVDIQQYIKDVLSK